MPTVVRESGSWQTTNPIPWVNKGGGWNLVKGIWVHESGAWDQVEVGYNFTASVVGSGEVGFSGASVPFQSYTIKTAYDQTSSNFFIIEIAGSPPQTAINSVSINGQYFLQSAATYGIVSGSTYYWKWTGTLAGLSNGNSYNLVVQ